MKASYKKTGYNYLPAILHYTGKKEILYGNSLASRETAKKYAQIEINSRNNI